MKKNLSLVPLVVIVLLFGSIFSIVNFAKDITVFASSDTKTPTKDSTKTPIKNPTKKPNVTIVSMAGTITSTSPGRDLFQTYGSESVSISDVLAKIQPEISDVANVTVKELHQVSSSTTLIEHVYDMSLAIDEVLADKNVDAVVINTGTNILEELAYWTDLTVQSDKPVIFTGAMRMTNVFSFDGKANLFNAIRLAASGETACYGTVVMLNDEFFAAREVTKTDALRLDTFEGGRYGALGTVDEDRIRTVRAPARVMACGTEEWKTPFKLKDIAVEDIAQVEIVESYLEASGITIEALADAGIDGIVTAGHGAGGISTAQQAARKEAIEKGVTFVSATRAGSGAVYDTGAPGIVGAADLLPQKARLLLMLSLTFSEDEEQVREWFTTIGMPEFDMSNQ